MTTVSEVYTAIADGPLTAAGLRAFPYVPGSAEWPAAYMLPPVIDYETLADTHLHLSVGIVVLVSAAVDKHQGDLLAYMDDQGALSIPLAFHQNRSLGRTDVDAFVTRARPLNMTEQAGYQAFGALFESSVRLS